MPPWFFKNLPLLGTIALLYRGVQEREMKFLSMTSRLVGNDMTQWERAKDQSRIGHVNIASVIGVDGRNCKLYTCKLY